MQERLQLLDEKQSDQELSFLYKVLRVAALSCVFFLTAASYELTWHVIPELAIQTSSSSRSVEQCLVMPAAGHIFGAIIGGVTIDRWFHYIDITSSLVLVLYAVVGVWVAYAPTIAVLHVMLFLRGGVEAWLQMAGFRLTMKSWKGSSAGPLHVLLIGYSIGSIVVSPLLSPLIGGRPSDGLVRTRYNSSCPSQNHLGAEPPLAPNNYTAHDLMLSSVNRSHITDGVSFSSNTTSESFTTDTYTTGYVTAYWVLAGLSLILAAIFVMYYIYGKVTGVRIVQSKMIKELTFIQSCLPQSCSPLQPAYAGVIVAALLFYHAISVPVVRTFPKFIFSYARDGPCMDVTQSITLQTAYLASSTIGRIAVVLISCAVHMSFILQVEVVGTLVCAVILFFAHDSIAVLWIFSVALAFFTGPIRPSAFAWANRYIDVTSMAQIVPQIGASLGDIAFLVGVGFSYEQHGPYVLWSYQLGLAVGICIVSWVLQTIGSLHGDRFRDPDKLSQ